MKQKLLLLVAGLSLTTQLITAQVPNYVSANGLVGWWSFSGNANDASTNANNGTVNGATLTADRFGNANSAYSFLNSNDNITISSVVETDVTKYSVCGWFKKNSTSINHEGTIFCGSNPLITKGLRFHIGSDNNTAWGVEDISAKGSVWSYSENQNYADDSWHFFVVVFDADNGEVDSTELKIYIDNIEIPKIQKVWGTQSQVTAPVSNSDLPTILGNVTGGGDNFKGDLDDMGIWNRVLTQDEINNLYNANICYQNITVTDTLVINTGILSYNPVTYNSTVSIYPNPANDHITIDCGNLANVTGWNIKIFNELGQQVFSGAMNTQQYSVPLNTWTGNGLYLVKIYDASNNVVNTKKIILQ